MSFNLIFSTICLSAYLIKLVIFPVNIGDSLVLLGLVVLYSFISYLFDKKEKPINEEVKKRLEEVENELKDVKSFIQVNKITARMTNLR